MEIIIVVTVVLILWTNESLFGRSITQSKPRETKADKLAKALAEYLKESKED